MYVIVEKDYEYPLFSSFYVFDRKTFLHQEEAERYLEDSKTISRFAKSMLKVVPLPSCQVWRLDRTVKPFQLYPTGTRVKITQEAYSPSDLLNMLESHTSPTSGSEVRSAILGMLYSLRAPKGGALGTGSIVEQSSLLGDRSGIARLILGYTPGKGYSLEGVSGFVCTHQIQPFKAHIFGEMSIHTSDSNLQLNQLFLY